MSSLALIYIENIVLQSMDCNDIIKEFASQKPRKSFTFASYSNNQLVLIKILTNKKTTGVIVCSYIYIIY